jgi:hypothetical protein
LIPARTCADAAVRRDFPDLFQFTLDEVEPTELSQSTRARIENCETADRRRGVEKHLAAFRAPPEHVSRLSYTEAWAVRPLPHRKETPRDIILSGLGGSTYLIAEFTGQEENVG